MEDYTKKLENIIKKTLAPLKQIPFKLVIENLSGFQVVPFDEKDNKDLVVLKKLKEITLISGKKVTEKGINRLRPNEAAMI